MFRYLQLQIFIAIDSYLNCEDIDRAQLFLFSQPTLLSKTDTWCWSLFAVSWATDAEIEEIQDKPRQMH